MTTHAEFHRSAAAAARESAKDYFALGGYDRDTASYRKGLLFDHLADLHELAAGGTMMFDDCPEWSWQRPSTARKTHRPSAIIPSAISSPSYPIMAGRKTVVERQVMVISMGASPASMARPASAGVNRPG